VIFGRGIEVHCLAYKTLKKQFEPNNVVVGLWMYDFPRLNWATVIRILIAAQLSQP